MPSGAFNYAIILNYVKCVCMHAMPIVLQILTLPISSRINLEWYVALTSYARAKAFVKANQIDQIPLSVIISGLFWFDI